MKSKGILTMFLAAIMLFSGCARTNDTQKTETFDYGALPFYDEQATGKTYEYNDVLAARPFWLGNVMYNESVMCIKNKDGGAEATTLFKPVKVLSVRDWTLKVEYREGIDYEVLENGKISALPGGGMPQFDDNWYYGKDILAPYEKTDDLAVTGNKYHVFDCVDENGDPIGVVYTEGPLFYSNYLNVTYVYDPADFDYTVITDYSNELSGLTEKLKNKEDIKMLVFGDSTSEGCSASKHWKREPFSPFYGEMVKNELERLYGVNVNLTNWSVGGTTSKWGAGLDAANNGNHNPVKIRELAPDLMVIGFGGNDAGQISVEDYITYMHMIADNVRNANPDCQLIFVGTRPSNPYFQSKNAQLLINNALREIAYSYDDAVFIDNYTLGAEMLKVKKLYEIVNNGVNHSNDFMHRVYAMNILSRIVDYKATIKDE